MAQPAYSRGQLMALAAADARKYGVDPGIFTRQISQESGFNPTVTSSAGAQGIAQFMPATAKSYGIDPLNPTQALDAAARYDASELKAFGGDYRKALAAYNAGAGNADKFNDPNFAGGQTYRYVRSILGGANPQPAAAAAPPQPTLGVGVQPQPVQPTVDYAAKIRQALANTEKTAGLDKTGFYGTLGTLLREQAAQPATAAATLAQAAATPSAAKPALPFVGASTQGVKPSLLAAVTQAAKAAGATEIRVTSGERSAAHNATVGGVSHSNHLTGDALDGYGLVNGQWVPLGSLLARTAGRYGLRSGDQPGFFNGHPDPVHIDDGFNVRGRR